MSYPGDRAVMVARVAALHKDGLNGTQIAAQLGLSTSYTYELLRDPLGGQARQRKRRRDLVCVVCGGRVDGTTPGRTRGDPVCGACAPAYYAVWTRDAIIAAIQRWADDHGGIPPSANDWLKEGTTTGHCSTRNVVEVFTKWNLAIEAAGFEPHATGPVGGCITPLTPAQRRACATRYEAGESTVAIAADFGCAPSIVAKWVRRAGVEIRSQKRSAA